MASCRQQSGRASAVRMRPGKRSRMAHVIACTVSGGRSLAESKRRPSMRKSPSQDAHASRSMSVTSRFQKAKLRPCRTQRPIGLLHPAGSHSLLTHSMAACDTDTLCALSQGFWQQAISP